MKFTKLKLFSPLLVKEEAPYENPWDGGEDFRIMLESEKKKCRNEICENITEMLSPTELPHMFKNSVYSAVPTVEEKGKKLMLVLDCECYRTLSEPELDSLCSWWEDVLTKMNTVLSNIAVRTKRMGKIYIYLHYDRGWTIEPVSPDNSGGDKIE